MLRPLRGICYHAAVSKPLPQIPIDGNVLSRSLAIDCPILMDSNHPRHKPCPLSECPSSFPLRSSYFLPLARIFQPQPPCILHESERAVAKIPAQKQRRTTRRTDGRLSLIRGAAAASPPSRPTIYVPLACWLVHSNEGEGWDKVW